MTSTERHSPRLLPLREDGAVSVDTVPAFRGRGGEEWRSVCLEGHRRLSVQHRPGFWSPRQGQLQLSKSFNLELPEPLVDPKYFLCVSK